MDLLEKLNANATDWIAGLSSIEKHAIKKYSWNSFETEETTFFARLNSWLRGTYSEESELMNEYAGIISGALKRYVLPMDLTCYRGSNFDMSKGVSVGGTFLYKPFTSTSAVQRRMFRRKYTFVIHIPCTASAAYIEKLSFFSQQYEVLIDKNALYRVLSRKGRVIELEVIENG